MACNFTSRKFLANFSQINLRARSLFTIDILPHFLFSKTVLAQAKRAVFIYSLLSCTGLSAFADNVETLGGFAYFRCSST